MQDLQLGAHDDDGHVQDAATRLGWELGRVVAAEGPSMPQLREVACQGVTVVLRLIARSHDAAVGRHRKSVDAVSPATELVWELA